MNSLDLIFLGAVILLGVLLLNRIAMRLVRPVPVEPDRTVCDTGLIYDDFTVFSNGHGLHAWLLSNGEVRHQEPLLILAHGWGASYGTVLQLAEPLVEEGYEALLFDVRGHGRNKPAPYVTVRHFRDDLMSVIGYAGTRFPGRKLIVIGHSFGGAASVLAAADGADIDKLVLIAAPSDVLRVTAEYLTDHGMPGSLVVWVLRPFWWLRNGGTFRSLTPSRRISEVEVPLLIIQPEDDERVTREHARQLSAASGVPHQIVPDCDHTSVLGAPVTTRLVTEFLGTW
ncbi:MAG: alpha/beta fold hydrolase [Gemmatimonadota bacterium]|nr:alpha/beta fold hydrolase [Gemmatimonadota bacterium]